MNTLTPIYTLEKHLEEVCKINPEFEILNAGWKLNKANLPKALSNIGFNFPHYSLHDASHSATIVKNIESFLGEERIKRLSPTDTWLILLSCYTHDLGMVVFYNYLENKWSGQEFQEYLKDTADSSPDEDLTKAANRLVNFEKKFRKQVNSDVEEDSNEVKEEYDSEKGQIPLEIRNDVILVTSEFFRRNHHIRSKKIISGDDKEFRGLLHNFYSDQIPARFMDVLAEIGYSHGVDFNTLFNNLEYTSNGFGSDKMHPRFVGFILRLGDLLDVDDKRFNIYAEKVFGELPKISQHHKQKHASIKHLLISPTSIEVTVDCGNDETYRVARRWFDWLHEEVGNQSRDWPLIAPNDLGGLPPTITRGKIKVLSKGSQPKPELMDLRFTISNEKVFEMLEGAALYDNPKLVFLREIVQNAFDAIKIQLWKDIKKGIYDFILKNHLKIEHGLSDIPTTTEEIIKLIKLPTDVPLEIMEAYKIHLKIDWENENKENIIITIEDNGYGISEANLIRMTEKVGESRRRDIEFQKIKGDLPFWLTPTGTFGIGLQSIFIVSKYFEVYTKPEGDEPKKIIFRSARKGQYSNIEPWEESKCDLKRGTRVIIKINKNILPNDIPRRGFDFYTDSLDDIYLYNLEDYIKENLATITALTISFNNNKTNYSSNEIGYSLKNNDYKVRIREDKIIGKLFNHNNSLVFNFFEHEIFGSEVNISFSLRVDHPAFSNNRETQIYIRDIKVKNPYLRLDSPYTAINFLYQDSEKLLDISRSKILLSRRKNLYNQSQKLLPILLEKCIELFEKAYKNNTLSNIRYIEIVALKLEIINRIINEKEDKNKILHKLIDESKITIPSSIILNVNGTNLELKDFFLLNNIAIEAVGYKSLERKIIESRGNLNKNLIKELKSKKVEALFTFSYDSIFYEYIGKYYTIVEMFSVLDDVIIYKLSRKPFEQPIKVEDQIKQKILRSMIPNNSRISRNRLYAISDYKEIAIKSEQREFSPYCIISPFKNRHEFIDLIFNIKKSIPNVNEENLKNFIINSFIETAINEKIIDTIKTYSAFSKGLTNEIIKNTYAQMITDLILPGMDDPNWDELDFLSF